MATLPELQALRQRALQSGSPEQLARIEAAIEKAQGEASHPSAIPDESMRLGAPGRLEKLLALANNARVRADPKILEKVHNAIRDENMHQVALARQAEIAKLGPVEGAVAAFGQAAKQGIKDAADAFGMSGGPSLDGKATTAAQESEVTGPLKAQYPTAASLGRGSIDFPGMTAVTSVAPGSSMYGATEAVGNGLGRTLGRFAGNAASGAASGYIFSDPESRKLNAALGGVLGSVVPLASSEYAGTVQKNAAAMRDELTARVLQLSPNDIQEIIKEYGSLGNFGAILRSLPKTGSVTSTVNGKTVTIPGNIPNPRLTAHMGAMGGELEAITDRLGIDIGALVKEVSEQGGGVVNPDLLRQRLLGAINKRFPANATGMASGDQTAAREYMESEAERLMKAAGPTSRRATTQGEFGFPSEQTTVVRGERIQPGPKVPVAQTVEGRGAMAAGEPTPPGVPNSETRVLYPTTGELGHRGRITIGRTAENYVPGKAEAPSPATLRRQEGTLRPNPAYEYPPEWYTMTEAEKQAYAEQLGSLPRAQRRQLTTAGDRRVRTPEPEENLPGMVFEQKPPEVVPTQTVLSQLDTGVPHRYPGDYGYTGPVRQVETGQGARIGLPSPVEASVSDLELVPKTLSDVHQAKTMRQHDLFNAAGKRPDPKSLVFDPVAAADKDLMSALLNVEEETFRLKAPQYLEEFLRKKQQYAAAQRASEIARRAEAGRGNLDITPGGSAASSAWRNAFEAVRARVARPRLSMETWLSEAPWTGPGAGNPLNQLSPNNARLWLPDAEANKALTNALIEGLRFKD